MIGNLLAQCLISSLLFTFVVGAAILPYGGPAGPVIESATMTVNDYARANASWEAVHGNHTSDTKINLDLHVPSLDIYDPDGQLVFHGIDPAKNAELLHRLPAELKDLKPLSPPKNISRPLEIIPGFQKRGDEINSAKKYTIYATSATKCPPCKGQDDAFDAIVAKKGMGMNVLRLIIQN